MKTEHTPTPWKVTGPVSEGTLNIVSGKQSAMTFAGYGCRGVEPKMYGGKVIGIEKGLSKEDAAFIVRAVNTHDELLSALRVILMVSKGMGPIAPFDNLSEIASRAIAKAEGK